MDSHVGLKGPDAIGKSSFTSAKSAADPIGTESSFSGGGIFGKGAGCADASEASANAAATLLAKALMSAENARRTEFKAVR